jgi:hypothetical protein
VDSGYTTILVPKLLGAMDLVRIGTSLQFYLFYRKPPTQLFWELTSLAGRSSEDLNPISMDLFVDDIWVDSPLVLRPANGKRATMSMIE